MLRDIRRGTPDFADQEPEFSRNSKQCRFAAACRQPACRLSEKIGSSSDIAIPPTTTPITEIMIGSIKPVAVLMRRVDFLIVIRADFFQNAIQFAGFLAGRDHLHQHRRKQRIVGQAFADLLAATSPARARAAKAARSR